MGWFFFFKQKTAYEIYQCDWSSDVCSSDLLLELRHSLFDNLISVGFFLFFLITAVNTLTTRGIAPKSHFVTWLIRITVGLSFITGISHAILQYLSEPGKDISAATELISQLPNGLWWLQTMHFISLIGYCTTIIILIIFIIKDLFSGERVTLDKIFGAITIYFLSDRKSVV